MCPYELHVLIGIGTRSYTRRIDCGLETRDIRPRMRSPIRYALCGGVCVVVLYA